MAKGLKQNALSIVDTITLAIAGSALSYFLNATTAALVAAVGLASPGALLYGAIPMFGSSGVLGMIGIFALFLIMQVSVQMGMIPETIEKNSASLLLALGEAIFPRPWGSIAVLAVLLSTIGTIGTQLTQCARTLFCMGRDRVIHAKFEEIHPQFQTPWLAGLVITVLSLFLMILFSASESIGTVMSNLISSIGVMVAFYYGMTSLACAWYYRKTMRQSLKTFLIQGVWSVSSAIVLLLVGVLQLPQLDWKVSLFTIGAIAIGLIPMRYFRHKYVSAFYSEPAEFHQFQLEPQYSEVG